VSQVYVIEQIGNLSWGVLQPGERKTVVTGRVRFTLVAYPYDGTNEPTTQDAVLSTLIPVATILDTAMAAIATGDAAAPAAGTVAAALGPIATSAAVINSAIFDDFDGSPIVGTLTMAGKAAFEKSLNAASRKGPYANGDWVHIRGGPTAKADFTKWGPIHLDVTGIRRRLFRPGFG
jgi:hypothetical protein